MPQSTPASRAAVAFTEALGLPEAALRAKAADLGRGIAGPWRAEQNVAAIAAWLVLAGRRSAAGRMTVGPRR